MQDNITLSPAMSWLQQLWDHEGKAARVSFTTLNQGMRRALHLAITMGLRFEQGDFVWMSSATDGYGPFGFGHWCGSDNANNWGESFYITAIEHRNLSAVQAFEHWKGRKPFMWQGQRLHLGSLFLWQGDRAIVRSFDDEAGTLSACAYKKYMTVFVGGRTAIGGDGKPIKRYTITHAALRDAQRQTKEVEA